ncbi:MAG: hypothetical protein LBU35_02960 [Holosporales bacterium]|jgi:adenylate cyclase|nr:hypothetical protein [Holosporales bacterium]
MAFFKNRKLRFDIFAAFSALMTFAITSEIWYSSNASKKLILDFEKDYYSKAITKTTTNWIDEYFNQLESIISVFAGNFRPEDKGSFSGYSKLFLETLKSVPYTLSIYIGFSDGRMFQARTLYGLTHFRNPDKGKLPSYAKFAIRTMEYAKETQKLQESWTYLNEDFGVVSLEILSKPEYNVAKSTWYVKTELLKDKLWSDVYIFKSSQLPGITLSMPLGYYDDSNAIGVIAVDFAIEQLKNMLESVKGSPHTISYLISQKSEVIVSTRGNTGTLTTKNDDKTIKLTTAMESNDPVLEKAILSILGNDTERVAFSVNEIEYIASIQKLKKIPCSLLTIVPQSDFIGALSGVQRDMTLISLFVYLLSFVIVWMLSKRISDPISALCESARAIGEMNLDNYPNPPKSGIIEIQKLSNAMNAMKLSVSTFSKYAPKDLVTRLVKTGTIPTLGGNIENVTMLFSDIEKFTTVSEKLPAEYLILHLSEYLDELTKEIMKHNGIIDKYVGDSIMAIWGAPNPDENQAVNACYAALRCQELLEELKEKWLPLGKPPLPTRIGIHSGLAIVGNIGSCDRMSFTAIGDVVNIASRLEGANKYYGTKILVSESVANIAKGKVLFRIIDKIAVKGKTVGITVYEPLCSMRNAADDHTYYNQIDLCSKSKEAFKAYQNQQFEEALKMYNRLLSAFPEIEISVMPLIEKCKEFSENPPVNWDGISHLTEK